MIKYRNLQFSYSWHFWLLPRSVLRLIWHWALDRSVTRILRIRIPAKKMSTLNIINAQNWVKREFESKIIRKCCHAYKLWSELSSSSTCSLPEWKAQSQTSLAWFSWLGFETREEFKLLHLKCQNTVNKSALGCFNEAKWK